ncbi:MAG: hypothetical protein M3327_00095 [Actinomycetota bacterium]|nr:hypothetical protein [Actinomycetota bacterium]
MTMLAKAAVRSVTTVLAAAAFVFVPMGGAAGEVGDETDPARNVPLACEQVNAPDALLPRSARNIVHVANRCGIVGTDVELQSRTDSAGRVHDYAFVGTMGAGPRIFDVTNPANPTPAGGYTDPGWENDVQVRGDILVSTFDGVTGESSTGSTCLKERYPNSSDQGVDIMKLKFDAVRATFDVSLLTCIANPPGGAHNVTLSPDGMWLAISNCCSDWALDVIDLRGVAQGQVLHRYRLIDASKQNTTSTFPPGPRCPSGATFKCIVMRKPDGSSAAGLWRPHDVHFSADAKVAYVAAINSTWIVDVRGVLSGKVRAIAVIPNNIEPGGVDNPRNIAISHGADVTSDGRMLVVGDERGGGLQETGCNTDPSGVLGGLHFFALKAITGLPQTANASQANPVKIGDYFTPNPLMALDPLQSSISLLPRSERGCTIHVFRIGGNGTASPGPIAPGYDGVSRLPNRQLSAAHYGAGVWQIDFSGPPSSTDGIAEDPRTTWGNTLGWNVMPGADTWSGKEYKGAIYAGDMIRGFDVYRYTG